ncbi:MAG: SH3 domain-containing protein [Sediminibacterium sp.]
MSLQDKYTELVNAARAGVPGVQVAEQDGVLHIKGQAGSNAVKENLWNIYGKLDPNFLSGEIVLDVDVAGMSPGSKVTITTKSSNLNLRRGPGTDEPEVGKAAHGSTVTLVSKANDQWWLVRTEDGTEGYAFAQYLTPAS